MPPHEAPADAREALALLQPYIHRSEFPHLCTFCAGGNTLPGAAGPTTTREVAYLVVAVLNHPDRTVEDMYAARTLGLFFLVEQHYPSIGVEKMFRDSMIRIERGQVMSEYKNTHLLIYSAPRPTHCTMRFEAGLAHLETLVSYISLAEFPRLHEFIRSSHFELIVGPHTLREIDYLTLGVIRHAGRSEEELAAAAALREHFYLGKNSFGVY